MIIMVFFLSIYKNKFMCLKDDQFFSLHKQLNGGIYFNQTITPIPDV